VAAINDLTGGTSNIVTSTGNLLDSVASGVGGGRVQHGLGAHHGGAG
jgi:hypothetical protein